MVHASPEMVPQECLSSLGTSLFLFSISETIPITENDCQKRKRGCSFGSNDSRKSYKTNLSGLADFAVNDADNNSRLPTAADTIRTMPSTNNDSDSDDDDMWGFFDEEA